MRVRTALDADRPALARLAAGLQQRPDRHCCYLGLDEATIAEELIAEGDGWTAVSAVAETGADGRLAGWLVGSVDAEMGRVWWYGPFVDAATDAEWARIADLLVVHGRELLPPDVGQEELALDARAGGIGEWAVRSGFARDPGSVVLSLGGDLPPPSVAARPATPADAAVVGSLHDALFPGTHTTGRALVAGADATHIRLVVEQDGRAAGYVAVERQPDGDGYIDFVGVSPEFRRRGLGTDLVRAAVAALTELGCTRHHLTVRAGNDGARRMYAALGFEEERVITPYRRGFTLP